MRTAGQQLLEDASALSAFVFEAKDRTQVLVDFALAHPDDFSVRVLADLARSGDLGPKFNSVMDAMLKGQGSLAIKTSREFSSMARKDLLRAKGALDVQRLQRALLGESIEPLEELDLSRIWAGVKKAAASASASFKRGYARGSGQPMKAKRLPDDTKADADAVPVHDEPKDGPKAPSVPAPSTVGAKTKAAKPPRAGKPDDKAAEPPKPAKAKPAKPAKPAATEPTKDKKPQAKCKPLKGRPGRFKCVSPSGQVYYKDSAGGVRRLK